LITHHTSHITHHTGGFNASLKVVNRERIQALPPRKASENWTEVASYGSKYITTRSTGARQPGIFDSITGLDCVHVPERSLDEEVETLFPISTDKNEKHINTIDPTDGDLNSLLYVCELWNYAGVMFMFRAMAVSLFYSCHIPYLVVH